MGGRGASSSLRPGVGGGGQDRFSPYGVGDKIPESGHLREALGTKGKPFSIANAQKNANPHYSRSYSEYSENCQRCVVAYELRRRGYDVEALPTYQGDVLPRRTVNGYARWMGAFKGARPISVGSSSYQKTQSNLESKMRSFGNGSRAVVRIPGHVFNCENVGGKIHYIEAQTGKRYTSKDVFSGLTSRQCKDVSIIRTDNLKISDRARNSVKKAK